MLTAKDRDNIVSELASRPGHEKVRVLLHGLLVKDLGVDSKYIDFEKQAPEVHGRIDALLGRTIFELKSDLRRERKDAEEELTRYLTERERQSDEKFVGIATDGADFIAFFLKEDSVVEVGTHHTDPKEPRTLLVWLQGAVALGEELPPDPQTIIREFGRESLAAQRALDDLNKLWSTVGQTPEVLLKQKLWSRLLGLAYGVQIDDDTLFLQHTYLAIIAKSVAWAAIIETPPPDAEALLHGKAFVNFGITGQNEPDFFDWVLTNENGTDIVMRISRHVNRFRLQDISVDILKALYESLIDPKTRHDLGEYYTPDWLAARMVEATVDAPLEQRVMDVSCGSGTFLFHLVRSVLKAADASGLSPAEAARCAVEKVAGIDIHPVAVIFARVTYLLALMPALRKEHPGEVALPVYLGDALQWNLVRPEEQGKQLSLLADNETLEIFVPTITITKPKPQRLGSATLRFPSTIASDAQLLDRVLNQMIEFGARSEPSEHFEAWMMREVYPTGSDRDVLRETYGIMLRLQNEGRNHIWGYVARNLARPVWLSSETQKADIVIGNPPWLSYRYMEGEFETRFYNECKAAKLWVGGNIATHQDLASYFYMRVALLYMRRAGHIAMVMPYAAMSRQAYSLFLRGEVAQFSQTRFHLRFTKAWAFGPEVQPLFPVPSCVLFACIHDSSLHAPLPDQITMFTGTLPRRDANWTEANANLIETTVPWPEEAHAEKVSPYRSVFRQGATLTPRRLVLVKKVPGTGLLSPNPTLPLVRGRTSNQDKLPWKTIEPPQGTVENEFLRPVLLGESIAPFRVLALQWAVIPWNSDKHHLLNADSASSRGYPQLAQWLKKTEAIWEKHNTSNMNLLKRWDYYKNLSHQFPIARVRIVYTASGTNLAACVIQKSTAIIEHKLYWAPTDSIEEARYLCGILNSEALRSGVEKYQSQGQWGARDFDKYALLPVPRFDDGNSLHCELAQAVKIAEDVANNIPEKEREYFTRTRKRVRSALNEHGIAIILERLVNEVLKDT